MWINDFVIGYLSSKFTWKLPNFVFLKGNKQAFDVACEYWKIEKKMGKMIKWQKV